ncbi:hypothetical protein SEA_OTTERSTEDTS21_18 [Gordonia phage OtterstedtS21]|uniref:Uncharacterized protein n=14 Tax=Lambovirus TaxID=2843412 RepID=A0A9E7QPP1_9CAUD|nr:hypothetical protein HWC68_gp19 [Gordonia phage Gibbin]YP_009852470.1 hypothetical protein HWC69_gp018 [Gordonia phage Ranch]YP_009852669.1 hypothetical protein HWC71_gp18 [Gordonia phage Sadboi]YP_009853973.1 hypothetical protein HWC82_gp19 [Gordonia phage Yikes]QFG08158.1 hypothetical protein PBI_GRETELLYN_18 [Gordonia phage GretelLyn]UJQ86087.1 hypothetical protein ZANY_17 [Gordonia phage Zany]UJQ86346.1 hypothetical protein WOJTEK_17 [Gordonia phage Wojtek]UVF61540.1 hypothetical prot
MALIDDVKAALPGDMPNWTDQYIEEQIADGKTLAGMLASAWQQKATKLYALVDVAESGSSRNMSGVYKNALELARYWKEIADKEEDRATVGRPRSRVHKAVRV